MTTSKLLTELVLRNTRHIIPIFLPFFVATALGIKQLAIFTLGILVVQIAYRLFFIPLREPILKLSRDDFPLSNIMSTVSVYFIISIVFISSAFILLEYFISVFIRTKSITIPIIVTICGMGFVYIYESFLLAAKKKQTALICFTISSLTTILVILLKFLHSNISLYEIFMILGIVPIVITLIFSIINFKKLPIFGKVKVEIFYKIISGLHWAIAGGLALLSIKWIDIFFIRYFGELYDVGLYNLSYQVLILLSLISMQIPHLIIEKKSINLSKLDDLIVYKKLIFKNVVPMWSIMLVILACTAISAVIAIYPQKLSVIPILIMLLIASWFYMLCFSLRPILNRNDKKEVFDKSLILGLIVNIVLDIILVPSFGSVGAAIATMITFASAFAYIYGSYRLITPKKETIESKNLPT